MVKRNGSDLCGRLACELKLESAADAAARRLVLHAVHVSFWMQMSLNLLQSTVRLAWTHGEMMLQHFSDGSWRFYISGRRIIKTIAARVAFPNLVLYMFPSLHFVSDERLASP